MNIRNAKHVANGLINCEYEHPSLGWIPYTASPDDVEQTGRDIFALASQGQVAPADEPTKEQSEEKAKRIKDATDKEAAKADPKLQAITSMSPDQVRDWIGQNIKSQSDIAGVLATLAVAVSVLSRKL